MTERRYRASVRRAVIDANEAESWDDPTTEERVGAWPPNPDEFPASWGEAINVEHPYDGDPNLAVLDFWLPHADGGGVETSVVARAYAPPAPLDRPTERRLNRHQ